ncbi:uncharacterized protein BDW47DRAFT_97975 [Aspergillus candidus]|uniref:Gamma-glutamylcyclotransferase AIG2-like domain-containing protein n=1 Tax=Aspergillus candidus TaxID=41067 RepID=A0A2I2FNH3_ASPCN|nr:hypothetical protein BDW47DRAFT_97975 [Aspergillus candidus]PLB42165.1 hypothetical protein BDW47DRAFT_97975 [Aspergillus candidus]
MAGKFMAWDGTIPPMVQQEDRPFREKWFFFYGPMTGPAVLKQLLNRSQMSALPHAMIFGHKILHWGDLPVAIQMGAENAVGGVVCKIVSQDELDWLEGYMTRIFQVDGCMAWLDNHSQVSGFVFVWDGEMSLLSESPQIF